MPMKSWKIAPNNHYIRRRDKMLVVVDSADGQGVVYHTVSTKMTHKVSLAGFKQGFRPAQEGEMPNEVSTAGSRAAGADD
jgi:hypothetical protein